jgi:hypothetical protein
MNEGQVLNPILKRRAQIQKQIEKIHNTISKKKSSTFKTAEGFTKWREAQHGKIDDLERESSMLDFPEEYDSLPPAGAADELGISLDEMNHLIARGEISICSEFTFSGVDLINREEIFRIQEIGVENALAEAGKSAFEIFRETIEAADPLSLEAINSAIDRIEARDRFADCQWPLEVAKELLSGNLEEAVSSVRWHSRRDDFEDWVVFADYLSQLLPKMKLPTHTGEALRIYLFRIVQGKEMKPYDRIDYSKGKVSRKQLDPVQQKAIFLATAVQRALKKYRHVQQFKFYNDRKSAMREEEFETVICDAIYTALKAEANYEGSAASRLFVDTLSAELARWCAPPDFLEPL